MATNLALGVLMIDRHYKKPQCKLEDNVGRLLLLFINYECACSDPNPRTSPSRSSEGSTY